MRKIYICLSIVLLVLSPAFGALVAQWDFSDLTYNDQVGSLHGTTNGTVAIVASGSSRFEYALQTAASGNNINYLDIGDLGSLGIYTNSFTLSMWIKADQATVDAGSGEYWESFSGSGGSYEGVKGNMRKSSDSETGKTFISVGGAGSASSLLKGSAIADGAWHWIVVRYDGDTDELKYFEDGVHVSDEDETRVVSLAQEAARDARLGDGFGGLIGDVRVYDTALTYTTNKTGYVVAGELYDLYPAIGGLVAHWNFSDGTCNDQAGNLNGITNGTIAIVASGNSRFDYALQTTASGNNLNYLNIGDLGSLGIYTNSFTLSMWVKADQATVDAGSGEYWESFSGSGGAYDGVVGTLRKSTSSETGKTYISVGGAGTASSLLKGDVIVDDIWHWIVVRYDGDTDELKYFEDGVHASAEDETRVASLAQEAARDARLGDGFGGLIGDVRIYDAALTYTVNATGDLIGGELYDLYPVIGGLVAHWDFSDGTYSDKAGFNHGEGMGTISIVASGTNYFTNAIQTGTNLDDVLNVGYLTSLSLSTNSFTLSYWIKRDPFSTVENGENYRRVFESNNSGTSAGIQTVLRASDTSNPNKLYSTLQGYGGTDDRLLNGGTVADGDWHWIVIRYDGDPDAAKYFEDGHYYETEYGVFSLADGSRRVYIGNGMGGQVGDIRIYNAALSYTLDGNNDIADGELYRLYGDFKPPNLVSLSLAVSNVLEMVIYADPFSTNEYYPLITADLTSPSWTNVPHSDGSGPFVITNLDYSASDGTNSIIYLQATDAQGFFGIGEQ